MKILDLKKVTIILVTMLLFLSMQISVFASDNCTVVKIPVKQLFDSEVEGIADEFSYIMTIHTAIVKKMSKSSLMLLESAYIMPKNQTP